VQILAVTNVYVEQNSPSALLVQLKSPTVLR